MEIVEDREFGKLPGSRDSGVWMLMKSEKAVRRPISIIISIRGICYNLNYYALVVIY